MRTGYVLKTRLSEYGALWLASFVLVLAGAGFVTFALGRDLIDVADTVLPISFALLGLAVVVGVGVTVASPASLIAKCLVTLAGPAADPAAAVVAGSGRADHRHDRPGGDRILARPTPSSGSWSAS